MKISQKGKALMKHFESLHDGDLKKIGLQPKMDPGLIWTEGWGRAMRDSKGNFLKGPQNKSVAEKYATINTIEEANKAFDEDVRPFEAMVERKLKVKVNQNQFDAVVSHTYNTGGSATLFDLINKDAGKYSIYKWFVERYITQDGKVLNGLIRRRRAEADLFYSS